MVSIGPQGLCYNQGNHLVLYALYVMLSAGFYRKVQVGFFNLGYQTLFPVHSV